MPTDPDINDQLRTLLDIEAIKQLKYRYIRLADAQAFDEWGATCFVEDAYLSTLETGGFHGRDNIVAAIRRGSAGVYTIHQVHMPEIAFTGPDSATGLWALSDYCTWEMDGTRRIGWGRGTYDERYVRTPDGWRIRSSIFKRHALPAPTMGNPLPPLQAT